jgi:FkbM family methyltransferase
MNLIAINPNPLMTEYLVNSIRAFEAAPITILDIGARGGFNKEWEVFGDQCRIFCFEPDQEECTRLNAGAPPHVKYIPRAVGGESGPAVLYEAKLGASTGLYRTNMSYFGRLLNRDNAVVVAEHNVDVQTLDDIFPEFQIPQLDFIKLDVEGAEVDVLKGGMHSLNASLLGVLSEIRFQPEINGSPTFAALDGLLQNFGLRLYDLQFYHQSRRALPYPGLHDYRLPNGERFFAYTTHGQIQDGDALYFRDLLVEANARVRDEISPRSVLKLCTLLEIYSFNDCAAELILAFRDKLSSLVDHGHLVDLLASGTAGSALRYEDYLRDYFDPRTTSHAAASLTSSVGSAVNRLPPWIAHPTRWIGRKIIAAAAMIKHRWSGDRKVHR